MQNGECLVHEGNRHQILQRPGNLHKKESSVVDHTSSLATTSRWLLMARHNKIVHKGMLQKNVSEEISERRQMNMKDLVNESKRKVDEFGRQ